MLCLNYQCVNCVNDQCVKVLFVFDSDWHEGFEIRVSSAVRMTEEILLN